MLPSTRRGVKGRARRGQRVKVAHGRLEFAGGRPLQCRQNIFAPPAVTADQLLFLDEQRPELQPLRVPPSRCTSRRFRRAPGPRNIFRHIAPLFHHQVHSAFPGDLAHLRRPVGTPGIHHRFGSQSPFNSRFAFVQPVLTTRAPSCLAIRIAADPTPLAPPSPHPVPGPDLRAMGQDMHGGAGGQRERCRSVAPTCSGSLTSVRSGTPTFSANPPSRCTPNSRPLRQSDSSPRAQNSHSPQNKLDCTATRSPIRHCPTPGPSAAISPDTSPPGNARQGRRSGHAPFLPATNPGGSIRRPAL